MPHLRTDTLEKYFFHRAAPRTIVRAEEHLLLCDGCRERLDEFDAFMRSLIEASEMSLAAGQRKPLTATSSAN